MPQDPLDDFTKFSATRYEAVIVAAKYARKMNEILNREKIPEEGEEEANKPQMEKIISTALKEVLEGKVKFERLENEGRKF